MDVPVIQYGFGEIGREIARLVSRRPGYELVEVVDVDKSMVGMRVQDLLDGIKNPDLNVKKKLSTAGAGGATLGFQSTGSRLEGVFSQLQELIEAGVNVVSTSEELAYPYLKHRELADEIDDLAVENGVTVLGTGINPGFSMDLLPLIATGVSRKLDSVEVLRVQDAATRREPLQRKIGTGLSEESFDEKVRRGGGHVGLGESLALLGSGLGWRIEEVEESIDPVIATERLTTEYFDVDPGEVAGIDQVVRGFVGGEERVKLTLQMYLGAEAPIDLISVIGVPNLRVEVPGGIHGDVATPAVVVNSARTVLESDPGLITPVDLTPFIGNFER